MSFNLGELQAEVCAHGFAPTTYNRRIMHWLNEAQQMVYRRVGIRETEGTATVTTSSGTVTYTLPTDFLRVLSLVETTSEVPLDPVSPQWLDELGDASGTPTLYSLDEDGLSVWPTPDTAYSLRLRYLTSPTDMDDIGDIPTVPSAFHWVLVSYALSRAYRSEDDQERADSFMGDFERGLAMLAADRRNLGDGPKQVPGMWNQHHPSTPGFRS